jgi:hypothetical protein
MTGLDRQLLLELQQMMHTSNPFVQRFITHAEQHADEGTADACLIIRVDSAHDRRTYNAPRAIEVAYFRPTQQVWQCQMYAMRFLHPCPAS